MLLVLALIVLERPRPARRSPNRCRRRRPVRQSPRRSLADLRSAIELDADHSLPGYFKTVIKGKDIIEIPCNITAVVDGLLWDNTPLIMFEATGPDMDRIGGIAAGMSGSPVFIDEGGAPADDDLVGAVSYGMSFTTGGLGLATPIEYMAAIETDHMGMSTLAPLSRLLNSAQTSRKTVALGEPVETHAAGSVEKIVVASSLKQAKAMKVGEGIAIATPLVAVQIGGLSADSAAARHLAAKLERRGIEVYFAGGLGAYEDFETPLVGGAAVGAAFAYGDYWIGGMGTVTYAHDDVVAAFGHPMDGDGETSLFMTNAYVHGVWSSSYHPQKIMTMGKIRGEITQDRSHGIVGELGTGPAVVTMTASASLPGGDTASAETLMPRDMPYLDWWAGEIAWGNGSMPVNALLDGYPEDVSADTTITVVVNDGTQDLTVDRTNLVDGLWGIGDDAWMILEELLSNPNGAVPADLISVDMTSDLVLQTKVATILDLEVPRRPPRGRQHRHRHRASVWSDGHRDPPGDHHHPRRNAAARMARGHGRHLVDGWWWSDSSSCCATGRVSQRSSGGDTRTIEPLPTLAEIVADIEDWPKNNDLMVTFWPRSENDGPWDDSGDETIEARAATPQVLYGYVEKSTSTVMVRAIPRLVTRGERIVLKGFIEARGEPGTVDIYKVVPGAAPDTLLATVPVSKEDRMMSFRLRTPKVKRATTFLAVWSGNDDYLGDSDSCKVRVR